MSDVVEGLLRSDFHWQMTGCEKFALDGMLQRLRPELSLEVGTYKGGSLQVLSRYSKEVISVDIDPGVGRSLAPRFGNVRFRAGDSRAVLPAVVGEINEGEASLGFVLIDGDHSAEGVRRDIEAILKIVPRQRIAVLLHDSFNPECRRGMRSARWADSPFVHSVELDFIPGIYHLEAFDTAGARTMWGGFACAILDRGVREGPLLVRETQRGLFEAVLAVSAHAESASWIRKIVRRVRLGLRRALGGPWRATRL